MAGANLEFTLSLQVTLALVAIAATPLTLQLFDLWFPEVGSEIEALQVAKQVALVQFLPLGIGLGVRNLWSELGEEIESFLKTVANTLFIVLSVLILVISLDLIPSLGWLPLTVLALLTLMGLAIGHFLGVGEEPDIQSGIAVATIARNAGLAIFIATVNGRGDVIPVIAGALVVGIIVGLPYSVWMKQKSQALRAIRSS